MEKDTITIIGDYLSSCIAAEVYRGTMTCSQGMIIAADFLAKNLLNNEQMLRYMRLTRPKPVG